MKLRPIITSILIASAAVMFAIAFKSSAYAQGDSGGVPVKDYTCVFFTNGMLQTVAPFSITGASTYTDRDGKDGTYAFDSASSRLTFHGGNYDGTKADCVMKGGKMTIYLLQSGHRSGITCN